MVLTGGGGGGGGSCCCSGGGTMVHSYWTMTRLCGAVVVGCGTVFWGCGTVVGGWKAVSLGCGTLRVRPQLWEDFQTSWITIEGTKPPLTGPTAYTASSPPAQCMCLKAVATVVQHVQ